MTVYELFLLRNKKHGKIAKFILTILEEKL